MVTHMNTDFKYMKVLIVEDDPHIANIIKVVLMAFSAENVHICSCYEDAVSTLKAEPTDCVFVDYMMSPVGGIKLIEFVRWSTDPSISQLPVILCTVYTDFAKIVEARDAGVSEILAKPITPMSIFHKTVAAVHKPRPFINSLHFHGPDRRRRHLPRAGKIERRACNNSVMNQSAATANLSGAINA